MQLILEKNGQPYFQSEKCIIKEKPDNEILGYNDTYIVKVKIDPLEIRICMNNIRGL